MIIPILPHKKNNQKSFQDKNHSFHLPFSQPIIIIKLGFSIIKAWPNTLITTQFQDNSYVQIQSVRELQVWICFKIKTFRNNVQGTYLCILCIFTLDPKRWIIQYLEMCIRCSIDVNAVGECHRSMRQLNDGSTHLLSLAALSFAPSKDRSYYKANAPRSWMAWLANLWLQMDLNWRPHEHQQDWIGHRADRNTVNVCQNLLVV